MNSNNSDRILKALIKQIENQYKVVIEVVNEKKN